MASTTVALNNASAVANTFTLMGQSASKAEYIDTDYSLASPLTLTVNHTIAPVGSVANDRHQVTVRQVVIDANGKPFTASIKVDISLPRTSAITELLQRDLNAYVVNYLTDARFQSLMDGITP